MSDKTANTVANVLTTGVAVAFGIAIYIAVTKMMNKNA